MVRPSAYTPITEYGGISGSAVYVMTPDPRLILAGFAYEAHFGFDIIYVTFAFHINADGTIRVSD
jgi:hypothetical protein